MRRKDAGVRSVSSPVFLGTAQLPIKQSMSNSRIRKDPILSSVLPLKEIKCLAIRGNDVLESQSRP